MTKLNLIITFQLGFVFLMIVSGILLMFGHKYSIDEEKSNDRFIIIFQIFAGIVFLASLGPLIWFLRREKPSRVFDLPDQVLAF
jgi:hypothetical protein